MHRDFLGKLANFVSNTADNLVNSKKTKLAMYVGPQKVIEEHIQTFSAQMELLSIKKELLEQVVAKELSIDKFNSDYILKINEKLNECEGITNLNPVIYTQFILKQEDNVEQIKNAVEAEIEKLEDELAPLIEQKNSLAVGMESEKGRYANQIHSQLETFIRQAMHPLVQACRRRDVDAVKRLIDEQEESKRADYINHALEDSDGVFHVLCVPKSNESPNLDPFGLSSAPILSQLQEAKEEEGKDLSSDTNTGSSADPTLEIVKFLMLAGGEVDKPNEAGYTPLHLACRYGIVEVVKLFIEGVTYKNETIQKLIRANIEAEAEYLRTPLNSAVYGGNKEVILYLLDHGVKIDAKTDIEDHEKTPLHVAGWEGHFEAVKLLIDCGAELNAEDQDKNTPSAYALMNGHIQIFEFLKLNGGKIKVGNNRSVETKEVVNITKNIFLSKPQISRLTEAFERKRQFTIPRIIYETNRSDNSPTLFYLGQRGLKWWMQFVIARQFIIIPNPKTNDTIEILTTLIINFVYPEDMNVHTFAEEKVSIEGQAPKYLFKLGLLFNESPAPNDLEKGKEKFLGIIRDDKVYYGKFFSLLDMSDEDITRRGKNEPSSIKENSLKLEEGALDDFPFLSGSNSCD